MIGNENSLLTGLRSAYTYKICWG